MGSKSWPRFFANSSCNTHGCGDACCNVIKYDSWLDFLKASTQRYWEAKEEIGAVYSKGGLYWTFVRDIDEKQKTDPHKMAQFLEGFTGKWYGKDKRTMQLVVDIFQNAKVVDSNKKRKLDENDDLHPPQKKLKR